jgi:transposase
MRYQVNDFEMDRHQNDAAEQATWRSPCNDRRVLNGIFLVLRSVHRGATCPRIMGHTRHATIASFVGGGLASGTRSWMH